MQHSNCSICAKYGLIYKHKHYSTIEDDRKLLEKGKFRHFCTMCRIAHSIKKRPDERTRVIVTSSTMCNWHNIPHSRQSVQHLDCWGTISIPGANMATLATIAIAELNNIKKPLDIIFIGGTFNGILNDEPDINMRMALYSLVGMIKKFNHESPNLPPSRLLVTRMWTPPLIQSKGLTWRITNYNDLADQINEVSGIKHTINLPNLQSILQKCNITVNERIFRERNPLTALHFTDRVKLNIMLYIINDFNNLSLDE